MRSAEFRGDHHRVEVTLDGCATRVIAHSAEPFRGGELVRATVHGPVHTLAT